MTYGHPGGRALDYAPCRYGASRLIFRGPACDLSGDYAVFIGGTDTYGRFVARPFADIAARAAGLTPVNLGCVNAGPDAFLGEPEIARIASGARATVIQLTGAQNLSNRFYTVHPRRNDRFVDARPALRALYPDVDFSEIAFTRHLIQTLRARGGRRFVPVVAELRRTWVERMRQLIRQMPGPRILLWMSDRAPGDRRESAPLFIDAAMIDALRPEADGYVEAILSREASHAGTRGLVFSEFEALAAARSFGLRAHEETAAALAPVLASLAAGGPGAFLARSARIVPAGCPKGKPA